MQEDKASEEPGIQEFVFPEMKKNKEKPLAEQVQVSMEQQAPENQFYFQPGFFIIKLKILFCTAGPKIFRV